MVAATKLIEDGSEHLLGRGPRFLLEGQSLGHRDGRCRMPARKIPGKGCAGKKGLEFFGPVLHAGEGIPLAPFGNAVLVAELRHLGGIHESGVIVLVSGEGKAEPLDRVADEADRLVITGHLAGETLQQAFEVMSGKVGHQTMEGIIVEIVDEIAPGAGCAEITLEVFAPGAATLEAQCRIEIVGTGIDPRREGPRHLVAGMRLQVACRTSA